MIEMEGMESQSSLDGSQNAPPLPDHPFLAEEPEKPLKSVEQPLPSMVSQTGVIYTCGSMKGGGPALFRHLPPPRLVERSPR